MTVNQRNKPRARKIPKAILADAQRRAEATTEQFRKKRSAPVMADLGDDRSTKPHKDRVPPKPVTDELMERLVRRDYQRQAAALEAFERQQLNGRWSHKQGTPETHERIEVVPVRQRQSPLVRMYKLGKISVDDLAAAAEIAAVIEIIERGVSIRGMTFDDRVDNSGSSEAILIEGLRRIRAEVAYTEWRERLPVPKRMVIDMIVSDVPFVRQARRYGMQWKTARKRLISALRMWQHCLERATDAIDRDAVNDIYERIGEQF